MTAAKLGRILAGQSLLALVLSHAGWSQSAPPRDSVGAVRELNAAYDFRRAGKQDSAVAHFRRAAALDPADRRAREELRYLIGDPAGTRVTDLYGALLYQSRFHDLIASGIARHGRVLERSSQLTAYLSGRITRDSRSTGGAQPVIYSDNVAVAAVGLRARPGRGPVTVYGEAGPAVDLMSGPRAGPRFDLRGGAYYAQSLDSWERTGAGNAVGDAYADGSYYSRYHNAILYVQTRPGVRLAKSNRAALDAVARLFGAADTRGDFYNNVVEGGVGLRVATPPHIGLTAYVDYVRGSYLRGAGTDGRSYSDVRLSLVYGSYAARLP